MASIDVLRAIFGNPKYLEDLPKPTKTILTPKLLGSINGFIGGEIGGEDLPEAPFMKEIHAAFKHTPS